MDNGEVTDYQAIFEAKRAVSVAAVFRAVYGWMCLGLLLSGGIAWYTATSGLAARILTGPVFLGLVIAEIALVWILSANVHKFSFFTAAAMFVGYAALNGLTLSTVFLAYALPFITQTFLITAGMFGGLAIYGTVTRSDLSRVGAFCGMAVWGLLLVLVVGLFFPMGRFDWIIGLVGVVIFSGLTMWDAQKITLLARDEAFMSEPGAVHRLAIIGALELYLDFINLFLMLLRFFGGRSRD